MDPLTHALSGAVVARALPTERHAIPPAVAMTVGLLAGAFPDIDVVSRYLGPFAFFEYHRGPTHSLILLPLWALGLGWLFAKLLRGRYDPRGLALISGMAVLAHILADLITAYGTMILAPLDWAPFSWPVTFILDPYFSGILLLALILALLMRRHGRPIALAGLALLVAYVGFQVNLQWQAQAIAQSHARTLGLDGTRVSVLPQPLSPYHWKLIVPESSRYHIAYVALNGDRIPPPAGPEAGLLERIATLYRPADRLQWLNHDRFGKETTQAELAEAIWNLPAMAPIRKFMAFPVLRQGEPLACEGTDCNGKRCLWFRDERFVLEGIRGDNLLFGACREGDGDWRAHRLHQGAPQAL